MKDEMLRMIIVFLIQLQDQTTVTYWRKKTTTPIYAYNASNDPTYYLQYFQYTNENEETVCFLDGDQLCTMGSACWLAIGKTYQRYRCILFC